MSRRTTRSTAEISAIRNGRVVMAQGSNIMSRQMAWDYVVRRWNGESTSTYRSRMHYWPWQLPKGIPVGSSPSSIRLFSAMGDFGWASQYGGTAFDGFDNTRLKDYSPAASLAQADNPQVIGAIHVSRGNVIQYQWADVLSHIDVGLTTMGSPFLHPPYTGTVNTYAGLPYVTDLTASRHLINQVRITSGPDAGIYIVDHIDTVNSPSRVYLRNLDGTQFVATATGAATYMSGIRTPFFNEVGVIPNGAGQLIVDGTFDPGEARASYIFRVRFEKTGSPTPADPTQRGTYFFSVIPWTHGSSKSSVQDSPMVLSGRGNGTRGAFQSASWDFTGGCPGSALDTVNQRYWACANDGSVTGSIIWWRYKTPECVHEVVKLSAGAPNDPIPGLAFSPESGTIGLPRSLKMGSDQSVYVVTYSPTGGSFIRIKSDLTAVQIPATDVGATHAIGQAVDTSRARTGAAGDVTTVFGGTINTASGDFTQSDVGRVIQVSGGTADAGLYKIDTVAGPTQILVKNLDGSATAWTGGTGGTFQIGDRIYLFFYNTTTSPSGTISYTESLAFGFLFSRAMTPVGGATNGAHFYAGPQYNHQNATIDPSNGVLYWASMDVAYQVNRYDPVTNEWSRRLMSDFNGANGGTGPITNPAYPYCLGVNPHPSFRELWIGTEQGWVKLNPDDFGGAFSRYFGSGATGTYSVNGTPRSDGGSVTSRTVNVRQQQRVAFGPDGRVFGLPHHVGLPIAERYTFVTAYNRNGDSWFPAQTAVIGYADTPYGWGYYASDFLVSPYGELVAINPTLCRGYTTSYDPVAYCGLWINGVETTYQWIDGAWVAKEPVWSSLPGELSPGVQGRELHAELGDLIHGVKVQFAAQGGETPANNEFLGRMGQTSPERTDGATTLGSADFDGSGFVANDVGRFLRIVDGPDAGVHRITALLTANKVTLAKLNPGTAFAATATTPALSYEIWEASEGPENASFYAAHGFGKDNTQDITNIKAEMHWMKTRISIQEEPVKHAIPVLGPPGSPGPDVRSDALGLYGAGAAGYSGPTPQSRAFGGTARTRAILAGGNDGASDVLWSGGWARENPNTYKYNSGWHIMVDLGVEAEIGSLLAKIIRTGSDSYSAVTFINYYGAFINIHKASGPAPVSAETARFTSVSGLNYTAEALTVALQTGDFLGPVLASGVDGVTVYAANRFSAAAGTFTDAHVGAALSILTGSDAGAYRITAVAGDGSWCDIRNLDQTPRVWVGSNAGVSFEIRDGAREDDLLVASATPSSGVRVTIERLLTPTSAEIRSRFAGTITNGAFSVVKPSWELVKRIEYRVTASPPEVTNNGTYASTEGISRDLFGGYDSPSDVRVVADFSDLPAAKRTGRYWMLSLSARSSSNPNVYASLAALELYGLDGKRVNLHPYNTIDAVNTDPAFLACNISRADWITASDTAAAHVAGTNGLASLGGANGAIVTLAGGNKFLGYQVRRAGTAGSAVGGLDPATNNVFTTGPSDPVLNGADTGRTLRITTGPNAGYYRVGTVLTPTTAILTTPGGSTLVLSEDPAMSWVLHDAILSTGQDLIAFGALAEDQRELSIVEVADDLTWLRVSERFTGNLTDQPWEIRRRCTPSSGAPGRLLWAANGLQATQAGDIVQDSRGSVLFHPDDTGPATNTLGADGGTTAGTATFTGSWFTPDDVGRILVIAAGADVGAHMIASYVSPTEVTVKNAYTGAAMTFNATAGGLSYSVVGERRFRLARYTAGTRT